VDRGGWGCGGVLFVVVVVVVVVAGGGWWCGMGQEWLVRDGGGCGSGWERWCGREKGEGITSTLCDSFHQQYQVGDTDTLSLFSLLSLSLLSLSSLSMGLL
jgi:hypothetical protein